MKKCLLTSLAALIALVAAGNAQAALATFSEDFQSYGANTTFTGSPFLQASYNGAGTAGKILESNGNRYFSVDMQDHDLWLAQAPGANDFQISFRQNQSTASDWNHVFAVYWTGTGGNHVVQMTRTATGVGFGDVAGSTGATPFTVPNSGGINDWLWFRVTRTGTSLKIEGSPTSAFTNAPSRTVTLPGATNVTLMGWKWQPTINVDDIKMAALGVSFHPGDANGDGMVDVGDLGILGLNYGKTTGATWATADFTGDGKVDVGDLGILGANYGFGVPAAIPEPATMSMLGIGGLLAMRRRRR